MSYTCKNNYIVSTKQSATVVNSSVEATGPEILLAPNWLRLIGANARNIIVPTTALSLAHVCQCGPNLIRTPGHRAPSCII